MEVSKTRNLELVFAEAALDVGGSQFITLPSCKYRCMQPNKESQYQIDGWRFSVSGYFQLRATKIWLEFGRRLRGKAGSRED